MNHILEVSLRNLKKKRKKILCLYAKKLVKIYDHDPFYNKNLTKEYEDFGL